MRFVLAFCFVVVRYVWCVSLCSVSQRFVLLFYFGSFRAVFFHFDLFRLLRQVSFPRVLFLCFVFLRFVLFCLLHYVWFLRLKSFFCNCSHSCTRILNVRAVWISDLLLFLEVFLLSFLFMCMHLPLLSYMIWHAPMSECCVHAHTCFVCSSHS